MQDVMLLCVDLFVLLKILWTFECLVADSACVRLQRRMHFDGKGSESTETMYGYRLTSQMRCDMISFRTDDAAVLPTTGQT